MRRDLDAPGPPVPAIPCTAFFLPLLAAFLFPALVGCASKGEAPANEQPQTAAATIPPEDQTAAVARAGRNAVPVTGQTGAGATPADLAFQ